MIKTQHISKFGDRAQESVKSRYIDKKMRENPSESKNIQYGIRNKLFIEFIENILVAYGSVTTSEARLIVNEPENLKMFETCFVHKSADEQNNYEIYEQLGDKIIDYSISKYIANRYPKLFNGSLSQKLSLKIISKTHLYLRSKNWLSRVAYDVLQFKPFVTVSMEKLEDRSVYEDIFEGFMGACDIAVNKFAKEQVGYIICYEIMKHVFNIFDFKPEFDLIIDYTTQLKEYSQKKLGGFTDKQFGYIYPKKSQLIGVITFDIIDIASKTKFSASTEPIKDNDKNKLENLAYFAFFEKVKEITSQLPTSQIVNPQLTINREYTHELTGQVGDYSLQAYVIVNGRQILFDVGYGYDEKSAKEEASKNAILKLQQMYGDVNETLNKWNVNDFI